MSTPNDLNKHFNELVLKAAQTRNVEYKCSPPWMPAPPTVLTNTVRPGDTPDQLAARKAPRGSDLQPQTPSGVRTFGTGATRDLDANKLDFEGFLSPLVLKRYAEHMHKARRMPDGSMRESDNWQLGIPQSAYMKSLWRHLFDAWSTYRGIAVYEPAKTACEVDVLKDLETELCGILFNTSGMLHEVLKAKNANQSN